MWLIALVLDLSAPLHGFTLPGIAGTPIEQWTLSGGHLAERMQLVLLIALGESVLRVGETFASETGSLAVDAAFVIGFVGTASLWAVYFLRGAEQGAAAISRSPEMAARLGRAAYAYAHAIMVGGVIVVAVGIMLAISDPTASVSTAVAITMLGGPVLYLSGLVMFKRTIGPRRAGPPLAAIVALVVLSPLAVVGNRLVLAAAAALVVLVLAISAGLAGEPETA